jgi:NADH/NAD ratio-sensing transcriptional regulator Rex
LGKFEHFIVNVVHRNSSVFLTCDVLIGSDIAGSWSFIGFMLHCYKDACMHAVHLIVHMSVCPYVCLFAFISWTTTGQIFMKFYIEDIIKIC